MTNLSSMTKRLSACMNNKPISAFRNNCHSSKFAQHLNEHTHNFGHKENIMQILNYQ